MSVLTLTTRKGRPRCRRLGNYGDGEDGVRCSGESEVRSLKRREGCFETDRKGVRIREQRAMKAILQSLAFVYVNVYVNQREHLEQENDTKKVEKWLWQLRV